MRIEFRRFAAPIESPRLVATDFVRALSSSIAPHDEWEDLDGASARSVATRVLHEELAYGTPMMPAELAEALAGRFVGSFGDGATFLTNGRHYALGGGGGSFPLMNATFDTGVVGVGAGRVGILWVADED